MLFRFAIFIVLLVTFAHAQEQPLAYHCAQDADVPAMKRAVVEAVATSFVRNVVNGDPGGAWDSMTAQGQQAIARDQFVTAATLSIAPAQPQNMAVRHVFMIHVVGTPQPGARVVCGADPNDALQSFKMAAAPVLEQAYTLISADGQTSGLMFTLWLVRQGDRWKVNSFSSNVSTLGTQDSSQLWRLAREQHQKGHELNATLLYSAAAQTAQRGPDFQSGLASEIAKEQADVPRPKDFTGSAPFTLKDKGRAFTVQNIGATSGDGKLFLAVTQEVGPWKSNNQVERWNQELMSFIRKRFPEVGEVFQGVVVQAAERGTGRTFASLDDQSSKP